MPVGQWLKFSFHSLSFALFFNVVSKIELFAEMNGDSQCYVYRTTSPNVKFSSPWVILELKAEYKGRKETGLIVCLHVCEYGETDTETL